MELSSGSMARVPTVVIQPRKGLFHLELGALWQYRELLYFLAWRDIKARYAQTVFGIGWAIIQPLFTMVIFTVIFGKFARMPSDGLPYPIFAYTALIPWTYFARSIERGGHSLVGEAGLVKKVYFPRLVLPISATIGGFLDFIISFGVLFGMMAWYGFRPNWGMLALPLFLVLILVTALSVSLWLSSLNTRYRDIGYVIPFLTQVWMYASPVVYPVSVVPERWRLLYSLNPMTGVIEGFRWALLGKKSPDFIIMALSMTAVLFIFLAGLVYFKRTERTFADIL